MKITEIDLLNVRGFLNAQIGFSRTLNVFIGPNNSGKSTVLNSIYQLQRQTLFSTDITLGYPDGKIIYFFDGAHNPLDASQHLRAEITLAGQRILFHKNRGSYNFNTIEEREPFNLIYPYLSKRKVGGYTELINEQNTNSVSGNLGFLYSKVDRIATPQFQPANTEYLIACKNILGFEISTIAKGGGKHAAYFIKNLEHIPITAMGEGVSNILGLIVDLCVAENKIFLIEEPENDIHPRALKELMKLIIEKSERNQFFISTHSHIVMKYLGSTTESKVFNITNDLTDPDKPKLYVSNIKEVTKDPTERMAVLEHLGYDLFDFNLWSGWLFLEESSAETLIRDFFIDWFVPTLKYRLRTFSARGIDALKLKFEDFNKTFVFVHLEPSYKNRAWVIIDGGAKEKEIIEDLRNVYKKSGWDEDRFSQFSKHDFEEYYPEEFQNEVNEILKLKGEPKRIQKKQLLEKVKEWIKANPDVAKKKFRVSAKDVINKLKLIESSIIKS